VEDVLEGVLVDGAVDQEDVARHQVGGQVAVDALVDLLAVALLDGEGEDQADGADEHHQAEEHRDQPAVQGRQHRPAGSRSRSRGSL
jgi:hypothetical protein